MSAIRAISGILCVLTSLILAGGALAADVEISEFMALNESTLVDDFGENSDWIELHNTTAVGISLEGWCLTDRSDDLAQWRFPAVTIPAGGYMLVFASGRDLDDPSAMLHTNFKLSGNGEYLALVGPDAQTVVHEYAPSYPPQTDDYSYGVIDGVEYFFAVPTPAQTNYRLNAGGVSFSADSGTFTTNFQLTLTAESPAAEIRYTTDGSMPTTGSALYAGPIAINASTRVRAMAVEAGRDNGPVQGAYYLKLAADVQGFDSNLPLVVLDTFGAAVDAENDTPTAVVFFRNPDGRTSLSSPMDFAGRSGIHIRGTSSTNFPKKQYKIELWDEDGQNFNADLFDLGSEADWVLHAPYSDKTYMRNYLAYTWTEMLGHTVMNSQYCEVFFNGDGDSEIGYEDYAGIYMLIEHIKLDGNRCDTPDMPANPGSADVFNGGFVIEKETSDSRLPDPGGYFNPAIRGGDNWVYRDPEPPTMTTAQKTYVKAKIDRWESVIWNSSTRPGYEDYADGMSFVDFELMEQLANNNDAWFSSAYVWLNEQDKLVAGPIWDLNIAFGNHYGTYGSPEGWQAIRTWGWWPKLFLDSEFTQDWIDRWHTLRVGMLSDDAMDARVDEIAAMLAEAEVRDHARWPTLGTYVWPNPDGSEDRDTWADELDYLKSWLRTRAAWIDAQYTRPPVFNRASGVVPEGSSVTMNAAAGTVYYTLDGSDPRVSGGSISPTALPYTTAGTTNVNVIAQGATWAYEDTGTDLGTAWRALSYDDSAWASGPAELGYGDGDEATVVASGGSPVNPTTYFRRSFTVTNRAQVQNFSVSLLADDGAVVYVNGAEIARPNMSSGTVTYDTWASATASEGVWLNYNGLAASLLREGENVVAVEIHQRNSTSSDISFDLMLSMNVLSGSAEGIAVEGYTHIVARAYNGGNWSGPAEGYYFPNDLQWPIVTEINYNPYDLTDAEIASGASDEQLMEFIEIYNLGDAAMPMAGFTFIDGVECELDPSAVLNPGEYGVVVADAASFGLRYGDGVKLLGVYTGALSNSGERLALADPLGTTVLDVEYDDSGAWPGRADGNGSSLELVDLAADPALAGSWRSSLGFGGSPGTSGDFVVGDVVINEVLTHTDPPQCDSIELYNASAVAVDISGWWLSDTTGEYEKYVIPDGTILPAGGYIVFDETDFNPTGLGDDEFALNSYRGDDVWLVATAMGQPVCFVDHVEFDAALNGESFGRWPNGVGSLYPMASLTLGTANSGPRVGPVVITELLYNPAGGDLDMQFIELCNTASTSRLLTGWRIDKGVEFDFPEGLVLPAGGVVVILPFDPADALNATLLSDFIATYGLDEDAILVGGWDGRLSADGETVRLVWPDEPPLEDPLFIPYLTMDLVDYSAAAPWPATLADESIQRVDEDVWSDDPANWTTDAPTPGVGAGPLPGDANHDGRVDVNDFIILKQNYNTASGATWETADFTGDGAVNVQDFIVLKQNYNRGR